MKTAAVAASRVDALDDAALVGLAQSGDGGASVALAAGLMRHPSKVKSITPAETPVE